MNSFFKLNNKINFKKHLKSLDLFEIENQKRLSTYVIWVYRDMIFRTAC